MMAKPSARLFGVWSAVALSREEAVKLQIPQQDRVDPDKFDQLTALFVKAILTHPEREQYERAFYKLFGPANSNS